MAVTGTFTTGFVKDLRKHEKLQDLVCTSLIQPCPARVSFRVWPGEALCLLPTLQTGLIKSSISSWIRCPVLFFLLNSAEIFSQSSHSWLNYSSVTFIKGHCYNSPSSLRITKIRANIAYCNEKQKSFQKGNWRKQLGLILLWAPFVTRRNLNRNAPKLPGTRHPFYSEASDLCQYAHVGPSSCGRATVIIPRIFLYSLNFGAFCSFQQSWYV